MENVGNGVTSNPTFWTDGRVGTRRGVAMKDIVEAQAVISTHLRKGRLPTTMKKING